MTHEYYRLGYRWVTYYRDSVDDRVANDPFLACLRYRDRIGRRDRLRLDFFINREITTWVPREPFRQLVQFGAVRWSYRRSYFISVRRCESG